MLPHICFQAWNN